VMLMMSQLRRKDLSHLIAARSSSAVSRPPRRARRSPRVASAKVRADVIRRPFPPTARCAAPSCSSKAASKALVSIYRNDSLLGSARLATRRLRRGARPLGSFATIGVDQLRGCSGRRVDMWPWRERRIGLRCRLNDAGCNERIVSSDDGTVAVGNQFGDDPTMSGYGDALAGLDLPHIMAEVVS